MYSQSILEEIKDRVSIVALIGERVPLKKAGRNYKGNCPFHSEKTPSFMVSDEKKIYHCFGCGEGGNIFSFFMKFDGLSFAEAVEMLAERAGVALPKEQNIDKKQEDAAEKRKKWAYRVNELVSEYFANNLKDKEKGELARNYLKSRDILIEKNTQHFLGYADDTWDGIVRFLTNKKVPMDLATELGLVKKRQDGGFYDFFRHRVMFPVVTPQGKIVAFSGRTFGEAKTAEGQDAPAKYLNSPDSLIYHKSHTVFGLHEAAGAIRKEDSVIIVEGNLDVIRLHQEGLKNVVAPLGTALTSGHLRVLSRYTKNFYVVFDGDEAGQKASARSLPIFLEAGLIPRVVVLPYQEDPDSFVRKNGVKAFSLFFDKSLSLFEWVIDSTIEKFGMAVDGKVKAVDELKPLLRMVNNPVELSIYKKRLANRLLIDESMINISTDRNQVVKVVPKTNFSSGAKSIEHTLIEIMLSQPETVKMVLENVNLDEFKDGAYQTIAGMIFEEYKTAGSLDVAKLTENVADENLREEMLSLAFMDSKYDDPISAVKDCIRGIKKTSAKQRLNELSNLVRTEKDDVKLALLMSEIQKLTKELHSNLT